jgi:hypothetical protein
MATIPARFERIERIWINTANKNKLSAGIAAHGYEWTHSNFAWLKELLHKRLRIRQQNRCCYCRRTLVFDKGHVELDHIVDKGSNKKVYARFTFEILNLALACKDCNNNKGTKQVLATPLPAGAVYPKNASAFLWVHPHIHDFSEHIVIHQGWVYEANGGSPEGLAVINKCMLDRLAEKERANRRVIVGGAVDLKDAVSKAVAMASEVELDVLCQELGTTLAKKWNSTPSQVEGAIRSLQASVQALTV